MTLSFTYKKGMNLFPARGNGGSFKNNDEKEKSMKTVLKNTKRILAVMLALALVVLAVPDTALLAAEGDRYSYDEATGDYVANVDGEYTEDADGNILDAEGNVVKAAEAADPAADPADPADPAADPVDPEDVTVDNAAAGEEVQVDNSALGASPYTVTCDSPGSDIVWTGVTNNGFWDGVHDIAITATPLEEEGYVLEDMAMRYRIGSGEWEDLEVTDGEATIDCHYTDEETHGEVVINANVKIEVITQLAKEAVVATQIEGWAFGDGDASTHFVPGAPSDLAVITGEENAVFGQKYNFSVTLGNPNVGEIREVSYYVGELPDFGESGYFEAGVNEPTILSTTKKNGGTFTIPAADLSDPETFSKGITIFVVSNVKSYTANVSGDKGYDTKSIVPLVEDGLDFVFTPSALPGYEVTGVKAYKSSTKTASNLIEGTFDEGTGTFTIENGYDANIWVTVTTAYASYDLDGNFSIDAPDDGEPLLTPKSGFTKVMDTSELPEWTGDYQLTYKTTATFKLTPVEDELVTGVTYTKWSVNDLGVAVPTVTELTPSTAGVYTIPGADIMGDVTLTVTVADNVKDPLVISDESSDTSGIKSVQYSTTSATTGFKNATAEVGEWETAALDPGKNVWVKVGVAKNYALFAGFGAAASSLDTPIEPVSGPTTSGSVVYFVYKVKTTPTYGLYLDSEASKTVTLKLDNANTIKDGKVEILAGAVSLGKFANNATVQIPEGSTVTVKYNFASDTGNFDLEKITVKDVEDPIVDGDPTAGIEVIDGLTNDTTVTITNAVLAYPMTIENKTAGLSAATVTNVDNTKTAADVTYAATAATTAKPKTWITGTNGKYLIYEATTGEVILTLKAAAGYVPKAVTITSKSSKTDADPAEVEFVQQGAPTSAGVYTFKATGVAPRAYSNVITVEDDIVPTWLTVDYDADLMDVKVVADKKEVTPNTYNEYEIRQGATASVTVTAKTNCKVTKAIKTADGKESSVAVKASGFTTSIVMKDDAALTVEGEAILSLNPLETIDGALSGGTNHVYKNVPYDTALIVSAKLGTADAEVENIVLEATDGKELNDGTTFDVDTISYFVVGRNDAGRTIKATVTFADTETKGVYTVTANKALDKISVAGVSNGKLTQQIGTTKTYAITSKSTGASLAGLTVVATDATNVLVDFTDEKKTKLEVSIIGEPSSNTITLKDGDTNLTEGGTITLVPTDPAVAAAKTAPSVTLAGATDNSLILKLGLPSAVSSAMSSMYEETELYWIIDNVATEGDVSKVPNVDPIPVTGTSQIETVQVLNSVPGYGAAQPVTFTASLVQVIEGTLEAATGEDYVFTTGTDFSKTKFWTKDPAYASKLTVSQKVKTVYAYDTYTEKNEAKQLNKAGDLVLGTVKADANATVLSYEVSSIEVKRVDFSGESPVLAEPLEIQPEVNSNGELVIPADKLALLNDLDSGYAGDVAIIETPATVTITAKTPEYGEPVTAAIPLTITPRAPEVVLDGGIDRTIYQKPNAATTVTLTPSYAWSNVKNNALVWEVNDAAEKAGVKVANGKVTIPKGYSPATVTVTATSSYNVGVNDSETITLTNEAVAPGNLIYGVANAGMITVVADNKTSVTFGALKEAMDGAGFFLLKKGAVATTEKVGNVTITRYAVDDAIAAAATKVTFTANDVKVVYVNGNNTNPGTTNKVLGLFAPGTATITAVTEDTGTAVKMSMKVTNDTLDKTEYMTIANGVNVATNAEILESEVEEAEKDFDKFYTKKQKLTKADLEVTSVDGVVVLRAAVVSKDDEDFDTTNVDGSEYYGQKLTLVGKNAVAVSINDVTGEYEIAPLAPTFQVKLGNVVYTVTDTAYNDIESEDTKTTQKGNLYTAKDLDQDLVLTKTRTKTATESMNDSITGIAVATTDTKTATLDLVDRINAVVAGAEFEVNGRDGTLTTTIPDVPMDEIPAGSYNLMVLYTMGDSYVTKWQNVTVKVTAAPKFTPVVKYAGSYRYNGADFDLTGDPIVFTGKTDPEEYGGTIGTFSLENVSTKGIYNNFTDVFVIDTDTGVIDLKDGGMPLSMALAADFTGNVVYTLNGDVTRAKVTISLETDEQSFAFMVADWVDWAQTQDIDWSKNNSLQAIQKLISQSMAIPANIKIAAAPANKADTTTATVNEGPVWVQAPGTKVEGVTLKTRTDFDAADAVPTHLYQKATADDAGCVYGTMKITTTKAVNDSKANDSNAVVYDFGIPALD